MSACVYRCNRCRCRNTFRRALFTYVIARKCRDCGHTRFYVDKERVTRKPCYCGGYHHAHRPGSRCCELHPRCDINRMLRAGASDEDVTEVVLEMAAQGRSVGRRFTVDEPVPF